MLNHLHQSHPLIQFSQQQVQMLIQATAHDNHSNSMSRIKMFPQLLHLTVSTQLLESSKLQASRNILI